MKIRRLTCVLIGAVTALTLTAVPSHAEPSGAAAPGSPLSAVPGGLWQTDQTVWAMAYSNGVLYVGGAFANVRPPGAALGTSQTAQARLAAFDATTGALISSWKPVIGGGAVFALDVSPDGNRLYVGGGFTKVNGSNRSRIAAFDITRPTAPTLVPTTAFNASANAKVVDIDATDTSVYAGGSFTTAGGADRPYVAAFSAQGAGVTPFRVALTGVSAPSYPNPFVTAVEHDAGRVVVGGLFDNVNGDPQHGLAVVDDTTGASTPGFTEPALINTSYVTAAVFDSGHLFVTGRDDKSGSTNRLEGVMALDADTGSILWGSNQHRCLGDSFALQVLAGSVWTGTHAHDCSKVGSYPEANPRFYGSVLGQQVGDGEQVHFYPETLGRSTVPGSLNNVRAFATDGQRLFVGGGFVSVNGLAQQNLTVFSPKTDGGVAPLKVARPTVTAASTGGARITWTTTSDRDDRNLTYSVFRRNNTNPFTTVQASSTFWTTPTVSVVDTAVAAGDRVFYKVKVTDGTNQSTSLASASVTIPPTATN